MSGETLLVEMEALSIALSTKALMQDSLHKNVESHVPVLYTTLLISIDLATVLNVDLTQTFGARVTHQKRFLQLAQDLKPEVKGIPHY